MQDGTTNGPIGKQRPIGKQIVLCIVTLGLYGVYWAYINHEEIKQHGGDGVGGVLGAVIDVLAGVVTLSLLPIVSVGALPAAFPVNHALLDDDVVIRSAPGTKLSAALDGAVVAFEVDKIDPVLEGGWSVLIQGTSSVLSEPDDLERARRLHLRTWAPGDRPYFVRVRSELVSGRRLLPPVHAVASTFPHDEGALTSS